MNPNDYDHRRNLSTPHAIPLQDLGQSSQNTDPTSNPGSHRRTLSDRGRDLFQRSRQSRLRRDQHGVQYAPVEDTLRPSAARTPRRVGLGLGLDTDGGSSRSGLHADDEAGFSPVGAGLQDAIGFAGLSYGGANELPELEDASPRPRAKISDLPTLRMPDEDDDDERSSLVPEEEMGDGTGAFPSENDADTIPLTDSSRLGADSPHMSTPGGQRHDRHFPDPRGIRFLSTSQASEGTRDPELGGLSPRMGGRSRSNSALSPTSPMGAPLRRAGTVMQKMSQRVVNLTNEADVVEKSIKRSPSLHPAASNPPSRQNSITPERAQTDGSGSRRPSGVEKSPGPVAESPLPDLPARQAPRREPNPLKGKSLGIFGPENRLRKFLLEALTNAFVEPVILLLIILQTVMLAVDSGRNVWNDPRSANWGDNWVDYAMVGLFFVYTLEIAAKVIVSGLIINPVVYSTIDRKISFRRAVVTKAQGMFSVHHKAPVPPPVEHLANAPQQPQPLFRSFTTHLEDVDGVPGSKRMAAKKWLARRAFLRHSFNRLDFLAVCAFWLSFWIAVFGVESKKHLYVFRMLSCLRILRLLSITGGTSVILRSLKRAMPILLNVAFLISFFWLLFAIIGIQSFKSSLRRTCVWKNPNTTDPGPVPVYAQNTSDGFQFCGGWIAANGSAMPYLQSDGVTPASDAKAKGYWCPVNSYCIEDKNPYNGTVSFDNLPQSLQLVFVLMTANTWSDIMYYLTDSDYLIVALFFSGGIVILTLWLVNLLIAVITSSFQIIREESRASAFAAEQREDIAPDAEDKEINEKPRQSTMSRTFESTHLFWISIILFGLIAQAFRSATMGDGRANFIVLAELGVTFALDVEIVLRLVVNWRGFFRSKHNIVDLFLAIVTSVIQIPAIRQSQQVYAWLTVFQIVRVYRVVLAVPITRGLIFIVLGNFSGLANLILFVFLLTFLAAIFATQLFRGQLPFQDDNGSELAVSFFDIWNAFLGMYQILSSENWTAIMYSITSYQVIYDNGWIGAAFCILWYILANFVVLNMFIAVIQENFDVSEDEKRLQQVKAFLSQKRFIGSSTGVLSLSSIFKIGHAKRQDPLDFGSAATEMLLKDAVVKDFLEDPSDETQTETPAPGVSKSTTSLPAEGKPLPRLPGEGWPGRVKRLFFRSNPNPFYSRLQLSNAMHDVDPRTMAREVVQAAEQRKVAQRDYLKQHPSYNTSLYLFKPGNPIRRFCQKLVGPGRGGDRIQGPMPSAPVWYAFSAFIYAAIVAMVLLACVTTPLYQKQYFDRNGYSRENWFVWTDIAFAALFTAEAVIKVIADGFFWTPNAYFRGSWGFIDGIVLITLWVNVIAMLYDPGGGSRAVGAFKALRALRLLNVSDSARDTFHSVIVTGGWKVVSAAFVSLSLLIPFAIYGLNLFNGQMQSCNDSGSGIANLTDCVGEYMSSPFGWDVLAPRQVSNSYYSFDDFGGSLFILFQIVSQEGWIDVMWSGQSITGVFTQPASFASQGNAVFFVIFNLLGAVFVLTLFVSVFMRNYTEQTGVAFLTTEQRSWLELRKLLRQVSPSKRPSRKRQRESWQVWCYKRAIHKTGKWNRTITALLVVHLILLCLEWYPDESQWLRVRDYIFLLLTLVYIANIFIRVVGLSWQRFRRSAWDMYSVVAVSGTFVTTVLLLSDFQKRDYVQLHKLFLVSVALMLIPRNNQLDQLFKTAAASLTSIGNLLATWFVMFLVFAIALNQTFGLTRFDMNESSNINVRTVPKALIVLFRTSVGEGWNQLMADFARVEEPYCNVGDRYYDGDCGSNQWAWALFILWNILSMYIFVNLFVSLIYESFSYVYQRSSGLSVISREEIRRFKQAWSEHDPEGTGYISKAAFPRLLGELSGVFEMRIYDGDYTVTAILDHCRIRKNRMTAASVDSLGAMTAVPSQEVDLVKLNERLVGLPVEEIRKRRSRMNTFYEEVLVSADPDKGIEFSALLMILAHYKVINDNRSLRLEEFLRRRARLQRVDEAVRRNVVVGFFDTLYWYRRFRRRIDGRKQARMTAVPSHDFEVPEIFVQDDSGDAPHVLDQPGISPSTPVLQPTASLDGALHSRETTPGSSRSVGLRTPPGSVSAPSTGRTGRTRADSNLSPTASPIAGRFSFDESPTAERTNRLSPERLPPPYPTDDHDPEDRRSWFLSSALTGPFDSTPFAADPYAAPYDDAHGLGIPTIGHHRSVSGTSDPMRAGSEGGGLDRTATLVQRAAATGRQRANTTLSHRGMMDELDNSAWGESIRRSFTVRRSGTTRQGGHSQSVSVSSQGGHRPQGSVGHRAQESIGGRPVSGGRGYGSDAGVRRINERSEAQGQEGGERRGTDGGAYGRLGSN